MKSPIFWGWKVYWSPRAFCQLRLSFPQAAPGFSLTWLAPLPPSEPFSAKFLLSTFFRSPLALPWCYLDFISCMRYVAPCVWSRDRSKFSSITFFLLQVRCIPGYLSWFEISVPWSPSIFAQFTRSRVRRYRANRQASVSVRVWSLLPWCLILR